MGLLELLAALFTTVAAPMQPIPGELVYRQGKVTWHLLPGPCASEILRAALRGEGAIEDRPPQAAIIELGSQRIGACWGWDNDADVVVVDTRGGNGFMPREWFDAPKVKRGRRQD